MSRKHKKTKKVQKTKRNMSKYKKGRKTKRRTRRNRQRGGILSGLRRRMTQSFNKTAEKTRQFARSARSRFSKTYRDKLIAEEGERKATEERLAKEKDDARREEYNKQEKMMEQEENDRIERNNQQEQERLQKLKQKRLQREAVEEKRKIAMRQEEERLRPQREAAKKHREQQEREREIVREKYKKKLVKLDEEANTLVAHARELGVENDEIVGACRPYRDDTESGLKSMILGLKGLIKKAMVKKVKDERELRIFETPLKELLDEDILKNISESFSLRLEDVPKYLDISMKDIGTALSNEEFKEALLTEYGDNYAQEIKKKLETYDIQHLKSAASEYNIKMSKDETVQTLISKIMGKLNLLTILIETYDSSIDIIERESAIERYLSGSKDGSIPNNSKVVLVGLEDQKFNGMSGTMVGTEGMDHYSVKVDGEVDTEKQIRKFPKHCVVLSSNVECEKKIGEQIWTHELKELPYVLKIFERIKNPISPQEAIASKTKAMKQAERKDKILRPINKARGLMRRKSPDELQGQET